MTWPFYDVRIWRQYDVISTLMCPLGSYSPETVKLGVDLCDLDLWHLTLTFGMDVTFVIGNNSWQFHDETMMGTWWKRCDGRTDGQTDRRTDWTSHTAAWSQLKIKTFDCDICSCICYAFLLFIKQIKICAEYRTCYPGQSWIVSPGVKGVKVNTC